MNRIKLNDLTDWIDYEMKNGNRIKASKLYMMFCKYVKIRYPKVDEIDLKYFKQINWD